ncbi:MAG: hypothetical protein ACFFAJ_16795 [Candidatus Hodarchaeota archaeon]
MEALKHTEWAFGVVFFYFAFSNIQLREVWIIFILIGSQLPDFLELFLIRLGLSPSLTRKITHDYFIVIFLWLLSPLNLFPEINILTITIAVHYVIDLFSGLEPIYVAGFLFGDRTAILYVTETHRIAIGKRIESWGSNYFAVETEKPTPELAWFWVMQLSSTIFCGFGIIAYLL